MRSAKTILLVIIAVLALAVAYSTLRHPGPEAPAPPEEQAPNPLAEQGPFDGLGLRFDGHYLCERGNLRYLLRFFPEGRVVTVNGTKEVEDDLPKFLTRETQGNPTMGLYNVRADVRGDSIFFVTRPEKGEISYRGRVSSDSTVTFFRHSHITGKDFDFTYTFRSDADQALRNEQGAQLREVGDAVSGL